MRIAAVVVLLIVVAAGVLLFAEPDRPICGDFLASDISGCSISFKGNTK